MFCNIFAAVKVVLERTDEIVEFSEFYIRHFLDTLALLNAKEGKKTKESLRGKGGQGCVSMLFNSSVQARDVTAFNHQLIFGITKRKI